MDIIKIKIFSSVPPSVTGWGIDLDYCDIEWFALEMNRDHSVVFEIASKYCILDSFFFKILILPKLIYRISIIPVKVQGGFFSPKVDKLIPKFMCRFKVPIAKTNWKRRSKKVFHALL